MSRTSLVPASSPSRERRFYRAASGRYRRAELECMSQLRALPAHGPNAWQGVSSVKPHANSRGPCCSTKGELSLLSLMLHLRWRTIYSDYRS